MGTPTKEQIEEISDGSTKTFLLALPQKPGKSFESIFPEVSPIALDLLKKMLLFDPKQRISVNKALEHPYLEQLHNEDDETVRLPVDPEDFEFEQYNLSKEQLKTLIYEEILLYHFPDVKKEYLNKKKQSISLIDHILEGEISKLEVFI